MTERELSSNLAALQSVCNLLDWEQQTATITGKSSGQAGVSEPLKQLRRRLIIGELGNPAGSKRISGLEKDDLDISFLNKKNQTEAEQEKKAGQEKKADQGKKGQMLQEEKLETRNLKTVSQPLEEAPKKEMQKETKVQDRIEAAISRELARMREQESRLTDEEATRQSELTKQAGEAWERCRNRSDSLSLKSSSQVTSGKTDPNQTSSGQASSGQSASDQTASDLDHSCERDYLEILDAQIQLLRDSAKKTTYESYLLDYEPCYQEETIDCYFKEWKKELRPLLVERLKKQRQEPPIWEPKESYSLERQRKLAQFLSEYLGFDASKGERGESIHPFTTALNRDCVYWSDHYLPENPFAGIFTALHETGHALYEQNLARELTGTVLAGGCSSAMHEAVARFYENCIGRMAEFWKPIYGTVTAILGGEFERLPFLEFMRKIRQVKPGCIRTEADELTYPYHILLRYELEKALFSGKVEAKDLPEEWNKRMQDYLGITPEQAQQGYLQDIHWSSGQFGYFPAYQTGNAIAAQLYRKVREVLPLPELLLEGRLGQLKRYLATHIFRYGLVKNTEEILKDMTGEPLQNRYYLEYLKERYGTDAAW